MVELLRNFGDLLRFVQAPREERRLVFYSEGRNYWPHLEGLVKELLSSHQLPICYISSDRGDPGLEIEHGNFQTFRTDEGHCRNWLFENMDVDVVVMTMPDIDSFQVKRSKHPVHYVYVQHSLVSLHMAYRPGAFDHYDTVFCAGPHHVDEIRAMERRRSTKRKNLVEHGYGRLDSIIERASREAKGERSGGAPRVLIAPSWGASGVIETMGEAVVDKLLERGYHVTLRPHPQTVKSSGGLLKKIVKKNKTKERFAYESGVSGMGSLIECDVMISDWSGAALDFAFGLKKPVVFIDVPRKVNNPEYESLNIAPFELAVREKVGTVVGADDLEGLTAALEVAAGEGAATDELSAEHVFNLGRSSAVGARAVVDLMGRAERQ